VLGVTLVAAWSAHGAFERQVWGGAASATGGTTTVVWDDPWALRDHPALGCDQVGVTLAAAFHPGAFGLLELRRVGIAGVVPFSGGAISGSLTVYGFELYREMSLALGGAIPASSAVAVGCALRCQHLSISGYGSATAYSLDAGVRIRLSRLLATTATLSGLLATPIGQSGERPPQEILLGLQAWLAPGFRIGVACTGDWAYPVSLSGGMEYRPVTALALRCGASTDPPEYTAGFALSLSGFALEYGLLMHTVLGFSHALSLSVRLASLSSCLCSSGPKA